jgi:hypothetical protein
VIARRLEAAERPLAIAEATQIASDESSEIQRRRGLPGNPKPQQLLFHCNSSSRVMAPALARSVASTLFVRSMASKVQGQLAGILIETTGLADPAPVVQTFFDPYGQGVTEQRRAGRR